jgi:DNA repair exonuclease SbcCD nuclease subunit
MHKGTKVPQVSRFLFVADVHVGNHSVLAGAREAGVNQRARLVLEALKRAVDLAENYANAQLVVLGDLFDTASPSPQLVAEVMRCFQTRREPVLLLGNHDMHSTALGDHALAPFAEAGLVVVERPTVLTFDGAELWLVPFRPGNAEEWLAADVERCARASSQKLPAALCLHLGIRDGSEPPWLSSAHDSVSLSTLVELQRAFPQIRSCFAGNWHEHKAFKGALDVFQVGTLAPTGWDNAGLKPEWGTALLWDAERSRVSTYNIPGPRFARVEPRNLSAFLEQKYPQAVALFVSVRCSSAESDGVRLMLQSAERSALIAGFRVEPLPEEEEQAQRELRAAAHTASQAKGLEQAVSGWIASAPIEEHVDRARATELALGFLRSAS